MSCPHRYDVAPYALGTLDAGDREQIVEHLPGCRECQAVLESVAGLPGLLARVDPDDVAPPRAMPDEAMFQRLLARTAEAPASHRASRRAPRQAPRRRLVLAAAAVIALAAGGGWAVHEVTQDDGVRVVAASAGPVHATVRVTRTASGTAMRLQLSGVEAEQECRLVAVDRAGRRTVAASWEAGYPGTETFDSSIPVPLDQLASLRVETDTRTLLTLPLS